ncbi:hypothetical protein CALCODRAFT_501084 [Calocera cornea HHB12733]|uniref:Ubiquitin 3 binding protein But2 C-terminal domain-containing protein n=1 Tax=Calocera cornea HHB12733 TaxID=1353952 RepID=A0A165DT46_9BASI|nr:hypothetical protein CALCODRAFT_501084 [Calocera cornea HHB12733]
MQILAAILGLTAILSSMVQASVIQKRASFAMDTFTDNNCEGFGEFIAVGAVGANSNPFPGIRKSFAVSFTDGTCEVILWTGVFTGSRITFEASALQDGTCFGTGESFLSFDIHCFDTFNGVSARAMSTGR